MTNCEYAQPHDALHYQKQSDETVICTLCNHHCHISKGKTGRCGVRRNQSGRLIAETYACVSAEAVDPIEKKPLYHFLPGTRSYSLGSVGCNFSCSHCQNWQISQAKTAESTMRTVMPEEGIRRALTHQCRSISWTYNEPTMWYEYTRDMGHHAHTQGLATVYVTNGYMTEEAAIEIAPDLNAWRVDIKAFSDDFYRSICKARLQPVLDSTARMYELGIHIETVTLIIPGLNDSMEEITELIQWVIDTLGPDTPMHFTRFHPDYHMTDRQATPINTLEKIYERAKDLGLHHPYLGNVSGHPYEHTYCPDCGALVINRKGYQVTMGGLNRDRCAQCNTRIAMIGSI